MNKEKTSLIIYKDDLKRFNIAQINNDFKNNSDFFTHVMNVFHDSELKNKSN